MQTGVFAHMEQNNQRQVDSKTQETEQVWTRHDKCKVALILVCGLLAVMGASKLLPPSVTVSNQVDGRELPIYCVETDQKVVGLSFDAAWD